jgi:nucleotide-binding universal stress UspA family protein
MNPKKILCPIDFSSFNHSANKLATLLAAQSGGEIIYLTVPEQNSAEDYQYAMERIAEKELDRLRAYRPGLPTIPCDHIVKISSNTAKRIVEFAEEIEADLIVMATHGRTGLHRLLMGSVAEAVVRTAKCSVLTVRPSEEEVKENEARDAAAANA